MPESPLFIPKHKGSDQPYRVNNDAYENVVITSRSYKHQGQEYYKYAPKANEQTGQFLAGAPNEQPAHFLPGALYPQREVVRYGAHRPLPPRQSPHNQDTSGYSSYEHRTLSLHRPPPPPPARPMPAMREETFNRTQQKYVVDHGILRQYFCVALTACILCPPCGFWSLYQAFKVDDMVDQGNFLGAERLARKIKRYSIVMLAVGVFWVTVTILAFFLLLNRFKV